MNCFFVVILTSASLKSYAMFRINALKGLEKFDKLAWIVLIVCPVYLLLTILASHRELTIDSFIYIYLFISFLYWLTSYFALRTFLQQGECELKNRFVERAKNYVKIVTANIILGAFLGGYVEIFYLKNMSTNEAIAFFNISLMVSAAAMSLIPGVYNAILMPRIVKNVTGPGVAAKGNNPGKFVFSSIRHMLLLCLLVAVPAAYYSKEIILLLFGDQYEAATNVLAYILISRLVRSINDPATSYFVSKDRQGEMLKITVVVLICSVIWAYFLVEAYGLNGAIISFCMTRVTMAISLLLLMLKEFKKIFDLGRILRLFLVSGVAIYIVSFIKFGGYAMIDGSSGFARIPINIRLFKLDIERI